MKKIRAILLSLLSLVAIITYGCGGGGGAGSSDLPPGENPGSPWVLQLWPNAYIAQTNASIKLYAKVLDGNGAPVSGVAVRFSNLSTIGSLSSSTAKTDNYGLATVTVSSPTAGFSTILAEIDNASGVVNDRTSVFFTDREKLEVSMVMDVESVPGNGTYNEENDFILFEDSDDAYFKVRVTVYDAGGLPVQGTSVSWSQSHSEIIPVKTDLQTNSNGQSEAVFRVEPSSIRNTETTINIMATAGNGAANMVTLFLKPVTISTISVSATPTTVQVYEESNVVAVVTTSAGTPAPKGTVVQFTSNCGLFSPTGVLDPPFYQITAEDPGKATSTFTAPSTPTTCEIKATSGGVSGSVFITVIPQPTPPPEPEPIPGLNIVPSDVTVGPSEKATYVISGGVAPYTVTTSHQEITLIDGDTPPVTLPPGTTQFTVENTMTAPCVDTKVTITVLDSAGSTKDAKYNIDCSL